MLSIFIVSDMHIILDSDRKRIIGFLCNLRFELHMIE